MAPLDLFSKRKKAASAVEDVYTYDKFPPKLAVQVIHIWGRMLPPARIDRYMGGNDANWSKIESSVAEEHGIFQFGGDHPHPFWRCQHYIQGAGFDERIDLIEASFRYASSMYAIYTDRSRSPIHRIHRHQEPFP